MGSLYSGVKYTVSWSTTRCNDVGRYIHSSVWGWIDSVLRGHYNALWR